MSIVTVATIIVALVALVISITGARVASSPWSQRVSNVAKAIVRSLRGDPPSASGVRAADVQRAIISAVLTSGVRLLRSQAFVFGNTVTVAISPQAHTALRPVRSIAVGEVVLTIQEKARAEGFSLPDQLGIELIVDRTLTNTQVRVTAATDDATPPPAGAVASRRVRPAASEPLSLHWIGADTDRFVLPDDGSETVLGRSEAADWTIDSPYVSGRHLYAKVVRSAGGDAVLCLTDRSSSNGSTIDGRRLELGMEHFVAHGAVVGLGPDVRLRVLAGTRVDETTMPANRPPASQRGVTVEATTVPVASSPERKHPSCD